MKRAIEQDTLQALVETGAAREFHMRRKSVWLWSSLSAVGRFCQHQAWG